MNVTVAGAPVSFGVFELTPEGSETISPDAMCEALQLSGYSGIDLGPAGFLGRGSQLRDRLTRFDLKLAGGWVQLPFSNDEAFSRSIPELQSALRLFAEAAESSPGRPPLPTLADAGSTLRTAAPGHGAEVDPIRKDAAARLYENVNYAAELVRGAGFEPTFHHHAGTYVESPDEIDAFLLATDVGLTLDTGHLEIAGGSSVEAFDRWRDRINHLHLKDVDTARVKSILAAGGGMPEVWSGGSFVAFGEGDLDLAAVLTAAQDANFDGWIVVEQDVLNAPDVNLTDFTAARTRDQQVNRDALRAWV